MLHETTRKRLGRAAFFALCVAPTLAVSAWILGRCLPGSVERKAEWLGELLHAKVVVTDWREPRPGAASLSRLTLRDLPSDAALARLDRLEWRRSGGTLVASVDGISTPCNRLDRLAQRIGAWLDLFPRGRGQWHCQRLTFQSPTLASVNSAATRGGDLCTLDDVHVAVERDARDFVRLQVTGRVHDGPAEFSSIRLTVERPPSDLGSATQVVLDASAAAIPAQLLACFVPGFDRLGPEAMFSGIVGAEVENSVLRGGAAGRLATVSLADALPAGSPHAIRGEATIQLTQLRWQGRRIEQLAGRLQLDDGAVSPSLIAAAAEFMQCVRTSEGMRTDVDDADGAMIALDALHCQFRLDGEGLALRGDFPADATVPEGCLAATAGRPLLFEPARSPFPAGAWIQFLVGHTESWLPATREAVDIAERLPLPGGMQKVLR